MRGKHAQDTSIEAPKNISEALEEGDGFWEDEQTMTQQMLEIEVRMAKERADPRAHVGVDVLFGFVPTIRPLSGARWFSAA